MSKETLLERRMRLNRPFTEMETLQFVTPLIENIRKVHATGKYHLRLRPEHITIDDQGNVLVTHACGVEFPGAAATDEQWEQLEKVKNKGFAAAEQRKWEPKAIGPWSDYYALGAVLCSMLGQDMSLGRKNELPEGTSPDLAKFINSLMSTNPEKRMTALEGFNAKFPGVWPNTVDPYVETSNAPEPVNPQPQPQPQPQSQPQPQPPVSAPEPVAQSVPPVPPQPPVTNPPYEPPRNYTTPLGQPDKGSSGNKKLWAAVGAIAVVLLFVGVYAVLSSSKGADHEAPVAATEEPQYESAAEPIAESDEETVMYPIVNVFLRSSPSSAGNANKVTLMEFGSKIVLDSYSPEWSQGTYYPASMSKNAASGYAATPFLINERDYNVLNGLLANSTARMTIGTAKCRRALLNYYNDRGLIGRFDTKTGTWPDDNRSNQWVLTLSSQKSPNEVYMERVMNPRSPYTDFAAVLEKLDTDEHRLVYFRFDADETPHFVAEANIGSNSKIYSISKASESSLEYVVGDRYGNTESGYMYIQ